MSLQEVLTAQCWFIKKMKTLTSGLIYYSLCSLLSDVRLYLSLFQRNTLQYLLI